LAFAAAGRGIVVCYHSDRDAALAVCRKAGRSGVDTLAVQLDVRYERQVERMFDKAVAALGIPGVLVNSAGLNMAGNKVADMELETWRRLIDTDLTGSFLTCRRMVRELEKAALPGQIINISSIHAEVMRSGGAAYDSAKAGLRALTATLALETAALNITVNAIAPGMILTPMNKRAMTDKTFLAKREANIPARRVGKADEVARLAVYLASPEASYITGTTITIDGGLSLMLGQGA
jgi:glucose 1-dehydrogenase